MSEVNIGLIIHKLLSEKGISKCEFKDKSEYFQFERENLFIYGIRNPDGSGSTNLECEGLKYQGSTNDGINFHAQRYIHGGWEHKVLEMTNPKILTNVASK